MSHVNKPHQNTQRNERENPYTTKDNSNKQASQPKKIIMDLTKHLDKKIKVKFFGGREVVGVLKGQDPLLNLVLDQTIEIVKSLEDDEVSHTQESFRELGLLVCRGPNIVLISPLDGSEEIENPFV